MANLKTKLLSALLLLTLAFTANAALDYETRYTTGEVASYLFEGYDTNTIIANVGGANLTLQEVSASSLMNGGSDFQVTAGGANRYAASTATVGGTTWSSNTQGISVELVFKPESTGATGIIFALRTSATCESSTFSIRQESADLYFVTNIDNCATGSGNRHLQCATNGACFMVKFTGVITDTSTKHLVFTQTLGAQGASKKSLHVNGGAATDVTLDDATAVQWKANTAQKVAMFNYGDGGATPEGEGQIYHAAIYSSIMGQTEANRNYKNFMYRKAFVTALSGITLSRTVYNNGTNTSIPLASTTTDKFSNALTATIESVPAIGKLYDNGIYIASAGYSISQANLGLLTFDAGGCENTGNASFTYRLDNGIAKSALMYHDITVGISPLSSDPTKSLLSFNNGNPGVAGTAVVVVIDARTSTGESTTTATADETFVCKMSGQVDQTATRVNGANYTCTYTLNTAGAYSVAVTKCNTAIGNSPLTINIVPAAMSAANSLVIMGSGISGAQGRVNTARYFHVQARDQYSNNLTDTSTVFTANITLQGSSLPQLDVTFSNLVVGQGIQSATYTATVAGTYDVVIKAGGTNIAGTPTTVSFTPLAAADASKSLVIMGSGASGAQGRVNTARYQRTDIHCDIQ
eukprot:TRINITY_DN14_c0_g1_i5.p1 TRINITY_DN14_c0_g1~~TRINITY_DN14_c0_g1_i5.p1  ORF type:complete len:646 (+),score=184.22 TRINITY_DN14_c0_g1_i5:27-1940(+)